MGRIHRDIKTTNVPLTDDFEPVIIGFRHARDFIARPLDADLTLTGTLNVDPPELQGEARKTTFVWRLEDEATQKSGEDQERAREWKFQMATRIDVYMF